MIVLGKTKNAQPETQRRAGNWTRRRKAQKTPSLAAQKEQTFGPIPRVHPGRLLRQGHHGQLGPQQEPRGLPGRESHFRSKNANFRRKGQKAQRSQIE